MNKCIFNELNKIHKCRPFEISPALLLRNQNDIFLNRIVTYDEKWILFDSYKCSAQWLDANKTPQHFPKP